MFACCWKKKVTKVVQRADGQEPITVGDKNAVRRDNSSEAELQDFSASNHQYLDSISNKPSGTRQLFTIDEHDTGRNENGLVTVKVHGSNPNEA